MKYICIDFDGTVVDHTFPAIGANAPDVTYWLGEIVKYGGKLILFTMRSDNEERSYLTEAIQWFKENDTPLYGIQENPTQSQWTTSPKAYGHIYIDDAAIGCPLIHPPEYNRPCVDWNKVGPLVLNIIKGED